MKELTCYLQVFLFSNSSGELRRSKILTWLKVGGGSFIIAGVFEALHLIMQFKQQPWAGDRVAQLQTLLCGRSLEICLGISRYTNTPGFLELTPTYIQHAKLSSMFLVSPPARSSICSILPCLTSAPSQCPAVQAQTRHSPGTLLPRPWLSAVLEFGGAGVAFPMCSVCEHRWSSASDKMQPFAFWPGYLTGNREHLAPHLRAVNYISKVEVWNLGGELQYPNNRAPFLVCSPPTHKILQKLLGKEPFATWQDHGFILCLCPLTSSAYFLVVGTLSLKLTRLSIQSSEHSLNYFCRNY